MSIIYHERPGVYSDYSASRISVSGGARKVMAVIGTSEAKAGLYTVTSLNDGLSCFGGLSGIGKMLQAAYGNGAGTVLVYSVASDDAAGYSEAIGAVLAEKLARLCCLESDDAEVQQAFAAALARSAGQKGECLGIVSMKNPTKAQLLERAAVLDSERVVLVGPDVYGWDKLPAGGGAAAAALCGLLAVQTDPALPLNGATINGFVGVTDRYEDTDIDALVQGGVTVLEAAGSSVHVLRGVTTRQTVGDGRDTTWREVTTVLIADDVIPGIRDALGQRFMRAKNNAATRSAIRALVTMELESRVRREIIEAYEGISVTTSATDACVCDVRFGFTVVHGLNRIHLLAHIAV